MKLRFSIGLVSGFLGLFVAVQALTVACRSKESPPRDRALPEHRELSEMQSQDAEPEPKPLPEEAPLVPLTATKVQVSRKPLAIVEPGYFRFQEARLSEVAMTFAAVQRQDFIMLVGSDRRESFALAKSASMQDIAEHFSANYKKTDGIHLLSSEPIAEGKKGSSVTRREVDLDFAQISGDELLHLLAAVSGKITTGKLGGEFALQIRRKPGSQVLAALLRLCDAKVESAGDIISLGPSACAKAEDFRAPSREEGFDEEMLQLRIPRHLKNATLDKLELVALVNQHAAAFRFEKDYALVRVGDLLGAKGRECADWESRWKAPTSLRDKDFHTEEIDRVRSVITNTDDPQVRHKSQQILAQLLAIERERRTLQAREAHRMAAPPWCAEGERSWQVMAITEDEVQLRMVTGSPPEPAAGGQTIAIPISALAESEDGRSD